MTVTDSNAKLKSNFQSFIFPIYEDSKFPTKPEEVFVGRSSLKINLLGALKQSENTGGCFLVGGYRGVGKSLLVKEVVKQYEDESRKQNSNVVNIPINISDAKVLNFRGVMTDSISSLLHKLKSLLPNYNIKHTFNIPAILSFLLLMFMSIEFESIPYLFLGVVRFNSESLIELITVILGVGTAVSFFWLLNEDHYIFEQCRVTLYPLHDNANHIHYHILLK